MIIYSNRTFDIDNDHRILSQELSGTAIDSDFSFRFNAGLELKKGLYYVMIRKDETRELLHISKFRVE